MNKWERERERNGKKKIYFENLFWKFTFKQKKKKKI